MSITEYYLLPLSGEAQNPYGALLRNAQRTLSCTGHVHQQRLGPSFAEINVQLGGHQNSKQKIHNYQKVKDENNALKAAGAKTEVELQKAQSKVKRLSQELEKYARAV